MDKYKCEYERQFVRMREVLRVLLHLYSPDIHNIGKLMSVMFL